MRREFVLSNAGISAAFDFIAETVARAGREATVAHRLSVIVDEVCANMIHHDASLTESDRFSLDLAEDGTRMVLVICDPGQPFNPLQNGPLQPGTLQPGTLQPGTLEHGTLEHGRGVASGIGGRGLDLIRGLPCMARYERAGACNRLTVAIGPES